MEPAPRIVVALYDSSDKSSGKRNDIRSYLEPDLLRMGFQVETHDIRKGLPSNRLMKRSRGVVTWYQDSEMNAAERYCRWLARQVRNGKKLVIIDNFGAYQDKKNGAWVPAPVVNDVFNQLGVDYRANWTGDPQVLQIGRVDQRIVGTAAPPNLADIAHYYYFKKMDPSVREYFTVRRLDVPDSDSAVIFSHPRGGMALSRYFTAFDPKAGREVPNIHFGLFLKECFYGAEPPNGEKVLIVGEPRSESLRLMQNLAQTLEGAKIERDQVRLRDFALFTVADLRPYSVVILCAGDLKEVTVRTAGAIRRYVREGGGLLVARNALHPKLNTLFGIRKKHSFWEVPVMGLRLAPSFFPAASFVSYEKESLSSGAFQVTLNPRSRVFAGSTTWADPTHPAEVPAAWLHPYGRGRVFYWNANFLYLKSLRGLVLHSILLTRPVSVFSFANVENIHVDDAPQPSYNLSQEPVSSTLKLTDTEFYRGPWWESVTTLSRKYGLSLTFYTIFNYDGRTSPPFDNKEFLTGKDNAFLEFTRKVVDQNFELGFHGYNHEPLVPRRGGKGWTKKAMRKALGAARNYWRTYLPDTEEPFSYVAPMNLIDREGKKALHETFPSIKVLSALFEHQGAQVTAQEFGPDPDVPELFDIPRITAGYFLTGTVRNDLINAVNSLGVWTHFIHPDDIFVDKRYTQAERKELKTRDWNAMRDSLDSLFAFVRQNYPWLRDFSTKEAYAELERYLNDRRVMEFQGNKIRVRFTSGAQKSKFFGVRVNDGSEIGALTNCKLLYTDKLSGVFLFESPSSWADIELKRPVAT